MFCKIQSVQFSTANNISKIHENRRQKSALGSAGLRLTKIGKFFFRKIGETSLKKGTTKGRFITKIFFGNYKKNLYLEGIHVFILYV